MEFEPIIVNRAVTLTGNSAANFVEVYSPAVGNDGYIVDFVATVQIGSVPQLPLMIPGDGFETDRQRDYRYYELVKDHPCKYLDICISLPGSNDKILRSRLKLWNSWPPYQQDLLSYLTTTENFVMATGSKLWVKIQDEVQGGSILWAGDAVSLWLVAAEVSVANEISAGIPRSATVSTSSTIVLAANPNRKLVTIVNRGGAIAYLNFGSTAVANAGISLNPGGSSYTLNIREINYKGTISAIASSSTVLEIMEAA